MSIEKSSICVVSFMSHSICFNAPKRMTASVVFTLAMLFVSSSRSSIISFNIELADNLLDYYLEHVKIPDQSSWPIAVKSSARSSSSTQNLAFHGKRYGCQSNRHS